MIHSIWNQILAGMLCVLAIPVLARPALAQTEAPMALSVSGDGFVPLPDPRRPANWIRSLVNHYKEGIPFPTKSSDYTCTDDAFLVPKLDKPRKYECRYEEVLAAKVGRLKFLCIQVSRVRRSEDESP